MHGENLFRLPFNFLSKQFGYHAQDVLNIFLGIEKQQIIYQTGPQL
jgi:hypothetical protein